MVIVSCPYNACSYRTEDVGETLACKLLEIHAMAHASAAQTRGPKLTRPNIDVGEKRGSLECVQDALEHI